MNYSINDVFKTGIFLQEREIGHKCTEEENTVNEIMKLL